MTVIHEHCHRCQSCPLLIKHYVFKAYAKWRHSTTILDLGTSWKRMLSFTHWPLYCRERVHETIRLEDRWTPEPISGCRESSCRYLNSSLSVKYEKLRTKLCTLDHIFQRFFQNIGCAYNYHNSAYYLILSNIQRYGDLILPLFSGPN